jgi:hypothetical protein
VERLLNASRTYPLKGSDAAKSPRLIQVPDREWQGWQLRDLKYWERLAEAINRNPEIFGGEKRCSIRRVNETRTPYDGLRHENEGQSHKR